MKNVWSVICQRSVIDMETSSLSLFDCIEQINVETDKSNAAKEKHVLPIKFDIVTLLFDEKIESDREFEFLVEQFDQDNNKTHEMGGEFTLNQGVKRFRHRVKINGLNVTGNGTYIFKIQFKSKGMPKFTQIREVPVDINISYKLM